VSVSRTSDDGGTPAGPAVPAGPGGRQRRPDESMSLLRELLENPLDAGYRDMAARAQETQPHQPWWRRATVLVLCIVMGMGGVWAAKALRAPQSGFLPARTLLVEQIRERAAEGDALRTSNAESAAEIERLRDAELSGAGSELLTQVRVLGVASGHVAVTGPGIVVTLEDSAAAQRGVAGTEDERVTDVDLQVLVNSLWASGAEAIAVNGQRLGPTSAVRTAGQAILVNLEAVVSPYAVEAVGDPEQLQTRLARTPASTHLGVLRGTYAIGVSIRTADDLELPGLAQLTPEYAEPIPGDDGGAVSPPSQDVPPSGDSTAAEDRGRPADEEVR
jgi:uncharacterized protein YlxW (UPF0749 family)